MVRQMVIGIVLKPIYKKYANKQSEKPQKITYGQL